MNSQKIHKITDPLFKNQWNLKQMNVPAAWEYTQGEGVVVGIIDSGVDGSHEDLGWHTKLNITAGDSDVVRRRKYKPVQDAIDNGTHPKILTGHNFIDDCVTGKHDNDTFDNHRHGTYLAGTIAAETDGFGMVGVAPKAKIRPYVVLGANGRARQEDVARALLRAMKDDCDVVNISLVYTKMDPVLGLADALSTVENNSTMIVVGASGNSNTHRLYYPASDMFALSIGGCGPTGERWQHNSWIGSTWNPQLLCLAPGAAQIATYKLRSRFTKVEGTSQAAANFTGIVALLKSLKPKISRYEISKLVEKHANKPWDEKTGWGVPDALAMVKEVAKDKPDAKEIAGKLIDTSNYITNLAMQVKRL